MIAGAGLAGLIAAHVFPDMPLVDVASGPRQRHRALLRFRTDDVGKLTGSDFRAVTVHKGIWSGGQFVSPTIAVANAYSRKVLARLIDRSIWNVEPVTRWVAPEYWYDQLLARMEARINWGVAVDPAMADGPVVSTIPMPAILDALNMPWPVPLFAHAEIAVLRFRILNADVFQTVYYPDPDTSLYRASITGDTLICEFMNEPRGEWMRAVSESFWLPLDVDPLEDVKQSFGKITPIDERLRQIVITTLTEEHNVFSLGRFATWRNILLDDVLKDAYVVKRLMTGTEYQRRMYAQSRID